MTSPLNGPSGRFRVFKFESNDLVSQEEDKSQKQESSNSIHFRRFEYSPQVSREVNVRSRSVINQQKMKGNSQFARIDQ